MAQIVKTQPLDDIATGLQTGTVGEPSFAASGQRMMMAGNWYASRSTNGGETWSLMDPQATLAGESVAELAYYREHFIKL